MTFNLFRLISFHTEHAVFFVGWIEKTASSKLTGRTHKDMYLKAIFVDHSLAIGTTLIFRLHYYIICGLVNKKIVSVVIEMNIAPEDQCLTEFDNLKFRKTEAKYIVFVIKNEKIVNVS